jgi:hypothetical protein
MSRSTMWMLKSYFRECIKCEALPLQQSVPVPKRTQDIMKVFKSLIALVLVSVALVRHLRVNWLTANIILQGNAAPEANSKVELAARQ